MVQKCLMNVTLMIILEKNNQRWILNKKAFEIDKLSMQGSENARIFPDVQILKILCGFPDLIRTPDVRRPPFNSKSAQNDKCEFRCLACLKDIQCDDLKE